METKFICPSCQSVILMDDVNVATDIALCRSCGRTCSFAMVSGSSEIVLDSLDSPPRGVKIETDFEGGTTIVYLSISAKIGVFILRYVQFIILNNQFSIFNSHCKLDGRGQNYVLMFII